MTLTDDNIKRLSQCIEIASDVFETVKGIIFTTFLIRKVTTIFI